MGLRKTRSVRDELVYIAASAAVVLAANVVCNRMFLRTQERLNEASLGRKGAYRILCIGESTTALYGANSYPSQLERILNRRVPGIRFSVINKGLPGADTRDILDRLEKNVADYRPDMIVAMMGMSDADVLPDPEKNDEGLRKILESLRLSYSRNVFPSAKDKNAINGRGGRESESQLRHAIAADPLDASAYIDLANDLQTDGKMKEAESVFKQGIHAGSDSSRIYLYREIGKLYLFQEKWDQSEEMFKKASELGPGDRAINFHLLGICYIHRRAWKEAETVLKRAIKGYPKDAGAYVWLARVYQSQKKWAEAERMLRIAVKADPDSERVQAKTALLYMMQGKNKEASALELKTREMTFRSLRQWNSFTAANYRKLYNLAKLKKIKLVCVQYPVRSVAPLKAMFAEGEDVAFVDNERLFKDELKHATISDLFTDMAGGDFGHATKRGNEMLARNVADTIVNEFFMTQASDRIPGDVKDRGRIVKMN